MHGAVPSNPRHFLIIWFSGLKDYGVIRKKTIAGEDTSKTADQSQLRALLSPMEHESKYIMIESHGRRSIVKATRVGEDALKIYGPTRLARSPS